MDVGKEAGGTLNWVDSVPYPAKLMSTWNLKM